MKKIFFSLSVLTVILGLSFLVSNAFAYDCYDATIACNGSCIWGCSCTPAPTSLPNISGCDGDYSSGGGSCGACFTIIGDLPCGTCGPAKALDDYACW